MAKVFRRIIAIVVWLLIHGIRCVPLSIGRRMGRALGRMAYYAFWGRRAIAWKNLSLAYGDTLTESEKRRIIQGAFEGFGIIAFELPHVGKFRNPKWRHLVEVTGAENVDTSRGAVFTVSHLANWEWMGAPIVAMGYQVGEMVNSYKDKFLERTINKARERGGVYVYAKTNGVQTTKNLLRQGVYVGIMSDQSPRRGGVPVTMFGQRCWATPGPALVALRIGVPIHHANMWRKPDGNYVLELMPRLEYVPTGDLKRDVRMVTQMIQDRIEATVRAHPNQYLWIHDRWKARPGLEAAWALRESERAAK